jgi:hypothetical protein
MISFNIASIPDRVDLLINTVHSIIDQVDVVNICLNGYNYNPFEDYDKINVIYSDNKHGDAGKFMFMEHFDGYYFTGDDDIIYPETYIKDTIKALETYKIVSYHGRTFLKYPIDNYYNDPAIRNRCLDAYDYTEPVHIAGTGVMAFHTKHFNFPFSIFKRKNMADIWVSCEAKRQGVQIWGLKHGKEYFSYQPPTTTIYDEKVWDCEYETKIVNDCFNTKKI